MGCVAKHSWSKSLTALRGHHISTERDEEILRQLNRLLKHDDEGRLIAEPMRFTSACSLVGWMDHPNVGAVCKPADGIGRDPVGGIVAARLSS